MVHIMNISSTLRPSSALLCLSEGQLNVFLLAQLIPSVS